MSHKNCPTKLQVSNLAKDTTHREMYVDDIASSFVFEDLLLINIINLLHFIFNIIILQRSLDGKFTSEWCYNHKEERFFHS